MPYTKKQKRVFQAIAHGFHPTRGGLAHMSKATAKKLLSHVGKRKKRKKR